MATGNICTLLLIFVCSATCLGASSNLGVCLGVTPCYCTYDNGQYLQLNDLGHKDGTPRFVNVTDKHEMSYSWNPCYNFTEGDCHNVALCGIQPSLPHDLYMPLGDQSLSSFSTNRTDDSVTLIYKTRDKPLRTSFVKLICINESQHYFKAIGQKQQTSTDFYFELRSPLACPQGVPIAPSTPKPVENKLNKTLEVSLIMVSIIAFGLLVALSLVALKMKGKICRPREEYDTL